MPFLTGAPVHFHALAFNLLAWGRKDWWVAPVRHASYSNEPAATRYRRLETESHNRTPSHFAHFVQHPLDIVVRTVFVVVAAAVVLVFFVQLDGIMPTTRWIRFAGSSKRCCTLDTEY